MDIRLKKLCEELRKMESQAAADWLMKTYPISDQNYGEAITLIPHRSWKKADQIRLAMFYLKKIPFASARVYETFASFMSVGLFINVIKEYLPTDKLDIDLLLYYLAPVLNKTAVTESDKELVKLFLSEILKQA